MKRIICLITVLCLVLGSFSFVFAATQDVSDAQTHTILGNIYNYISGTNISGRLNNINNHLDDINYNLVTIMGWLDPSTGGSTTALLNKILSMISYTDAGGALKSWLADIWQLNATNLPYIYNLYTNLSTRQFNFTPVTNLANGQYSFGSALSFDFLTSMIFGLNSVLVNDAMIYGYTFDYLGTGYNSQQTYTNPITLQTANFTPTSITNGIYTWLSKIQEPAARLSYVLASPERIEAQEAAAANEEAVVNNFIDSTGDGSASPSDIRSISDLSAGYKSNFGSDASVSGIFNIFNSNNMGWFSQETANQLDTTTPTRRGSSFETPLLDQQIEDIYDQIGVKHD